MSLSFFLCVVIYITTFFWFGIKILCGFLFPYRLSSTDESQNKATRELAHNLTKSDALVGDKKSIEVQKVIASNIDEGAWYVCDKVWQLFDTPIVEDNELALMERLADIQVKHSFRECQIDI